MNTNEDVKIQRSEQRLPSVSSGISFDSCSVHKRKTNEDERALTTYKNKQHLRELGGETRTNNLKKALFYGNDTFICYKSKQCILLWL